MCAHVCVNFEVAVFYVNEWEPCMCVQAVSAFTKGERDPWAVPHNQSACLAPSD